MGELFENILVTINEPKTDDYKKEKTTFFDRNIKRMTHQQTTTKTLSN